MSFKVMDKKGLFFKPTTRGSVDSIVPSFSSFEQLKLEL